MTDSRTAFETTTDEQPARSKLGVELDVAIVLVTFTVLVSIKLLGWLIARRHTDGDTEDQRLFVDAASNIPVDVVAYTGGLALALTILVSNTEVLLHPLSGDGHSKLASCTAFAAVGHVLYRLVLLCFAAIHGHDWNGLDVIGYVIGTAAAVTVAITCRLNMLLIVGLAYQVPLLFSSIENFFESKRSGHTLTSVVCVVASSTCMLLTPAAAAISILVNDRHAPLTIWQAIVVATSLTYCLLYGIWFVVVKANALRRSWKGQRVVLRPPGFGSRTPLLSNQVLPFYYNVPRNHGVRPEATNTKNIY